MEDQKKGCDGDGESSMTKTIQCKEHELLELEPIEPKFATDDSVREFLNYEDLAYFEDPPGREESFSGIFTKRNLDQLIPEAKYAVDTYNSIKNTNLELVAIEKAFYICWVSLSHMTLTVKDNGNGGKQSTYLACVWNSYDGYVLGIFLEKDDKVLPFLKSETSKKRPRDAPIRKRGLVIER